MVLSSFQHVAQAIRMRHAMEQTASGHVGVLETLCRARRQVWHFKGSLSNGVKSNFRLVSVMDGENPLLCLELVGSAFNNTWLRVNAPLRAPVALPVSVWGCECDTRLSRRSTFCFSQVVIKTSVPCPVCSSPGNP